jgi:gamma-glutamyltranspeptidase/glutathione hydrolase
MIRQISRRQMLKESGRAFLVGTISTSIASADTNSITASQTFEAISGEETGAAVGLKILREGGNAIDAAVGAALASCAATPARCGIGGYGGHMMVALAKDRKVCSIDFNSVAPAAARPDMYPLDARGQVQDRGNLYGWLATGVPGTLAGLQLALNRYGTRSFRELVQPAIRIADEGLVITTAFAQAIRGATPRFRTDPGSAKIYLRNGQPLEQGNLLRNPDLARLLSTLADRGNVDSFYRGDIGSALAEGIQKNGGLVKPGDLADYKAREVEPLRRKENGYEICTAPLTAGGLTMVQIFSALKVLPWKADDSATFLHARLEALRLAWKDRLELLGDPLKTPIPMARLLSAKYAREMAERVEKAVREKRALALQVEQTLEQGTNNFSCVDRHGNMVALTLTHGGSFGAQVTIEGLGLTLGHGMSRFNPRPGHPNAPGPAKRPLNNMCPTIVLRQGGQCLPWAAREVLKSLTQFLMSW